MSSSSILADSVLLGSCRDKRGSNSSSRASFLSLSSSFIKIIFFFSLTGSIGVCDKNAYQSFGPTASFCFELDILCTIACLELLVAARTVSTARSGSKGWGSILLRCSLLCKCERQISQNSVSSPHGFSHRKH